MVRSTCDIVAVGAGPSNLSFGALLQGARVPGHHLSILEAKPAPRWHGGQLIADTQLQSEWYRDLVTRIDPTNSYGYLSFLHSLDRLDRFFNAGIRLPDRTEFDAYLGWVSERLGVIEYGRHVTAIEYDDGIDRWRVLVKGAPGAPQSEALCDIVVLGTGIEPLLPVDISGCADLACHASTFLYDEPRGDHRRVLVVGSGQSGAEIFLHLIRGLSLGVAAVDWVTRDSNFRTLDTGHFSREFYSSSAVDAYFATTNDVKARMVSDNSHAFKGISPSTAEAIYKELYRIEGGFGAIPKETVRLSAFQEVISVSPVRNDTALVGFRDHASGQTYAREFEMVVFCTGFREVPLGLISGLEHVKTPFRVSSDYELLDARKGRCRIFVQSHLQDTHGPSQSNFVCAPARNAAIINAIFSAEIYRVPRVDMFVQGAL